MPTLLKINLSRKITQDFQSKGFGLEIQAELPTSAVQNPNEMAQASDELFRLAEDLLEEQVRQAQSGQAGSTTNRPRPQPTGAGPVLTGQARTNGNGHRLNGGNTYRPQGTPSANGSGRLVTEAQVRAINKMAQRLDTNGDTVAAEDFDGKALRQLTVKEASQAIDNLKKAIESQAVQGGR